MLKRLLTLAKKLDSAGLTKEADLADKIAQMDELAAEGYHGMPGGLELREDREFSYDDEQGAEPADPNFDLTEPEEEGVLYDKHREVSPENAPLYRAFLVGGKDGPKEITDMYYEDTGMYDGNDRHSDYPIETIFGAKLSDILEGLDGYAYEGYGSPRTRPMTGYITITDPDTYEVTKIINFRNKRTETMRNYDSGQRADITESRNSEIVTFRGVGPLSSLGEFNPYDAPGLNTELSKLISKEYLDILGYKSPRPDWKNTPDEMSDEYDKDRREVPMGKDIEKIIGEAKIIKSLTTLANDLDSAGLNKEADTVDQILRRAMDEYDDTEGDWESFDSMEGAGEGEDPLDLEGPPEGMSTPEGGGAVEALVAQLEAMKGMVEEGLVDEAQLAEVQSQVDAMMSLFLGGGPGMLGDEAIESGGDAFGGSLELGGDGIESQELPVAEARARRTRMRIRGLK
jgi:hypothetical protein